MTGLKRKASDERGQMGQLAFFHRVTQPSAFASWLTDGEEHRIIQLFFLRSLRIQLINRRSQALLARLHIAPDIPITLMPRGLLGVLHAFLLGKLP